MAQTFNPGSSLMRKKIGQYEATTGRRMTPDLINAIITAELADKRAREAEGRTFELQERGLAISERAQTASEKAAKAEGRAATVSGITQLAQTGVTGALLYKTFKPTPPVPGTAGTAGAAGTTGAVPSLEGVPTLQAPVIPGTEAIVADAGPSSLSATAGAAGLAVGAAVGTRALGKAVTPAVDEALGRSTAEDVRRQTQSPMGGVGSFAEREVSKSLGSTAGQIVGWSLDPVGKSLDVVGGAIGTVICTELHKQGYITPRILELDSLYRKRHVPEHTYQGYLWWGEKVVRLMQKSRIVTRVIAPFGVAWATEMAHRVSPEESRGSMLGWALNFVGLPLCAVLGRIRKRLGR